MPLTTWRSLCWPWRRFLLLCNVVLFLREPFSPVSTLPVRSKTLVFASAKKVLFLVWVPNFFGFCFQTKFWMIFLFRSCGERVQTSRRWVRGKVRKDVRRQRSSSLYHAFDWNERRLARFQALAFGQGDSKEDSYLHWGSQRFAGLFFLCSFFFFFFLVDSFLTDFFASGSNLALMSASALCASSRLAPRKIWSSSKRRRPSGSMTAGRSLKFARRPSKLSKCWQSIVSSSINFLLPLSPTLRCILRRILIIHIDFNLFRREKVHLSTSTPARTFFIVSRGPSTPFHQQCCSIYDPACDFVKLFVPPAPPPPPKKKPNLTKFCSLLLQRGSLSTPKLPSSATSF